MMILAEVFDKLVQHPIYGLGAAGGLAFGGFYGIDGWKGSLKEVELKDSPRVKNFFWLIGAAATAFIADIELVDKTAQKPVLLLLYTLFAFLGIFFTICGFALLTLISVRQSVSAYSLGDALGDYLQHGYQYFRKVKEERAKDFLPLQAEQQRLPVYLRQLTNSITIAGADVPPEEKKILARQLLIAVNEVVSSRQSSPAVVRTNFMRVATCSPEMRRSIKFIDDETPILRCLELELYDSGVEPQDFRLPLLDKLNLPGAPAALHHSKPVIIDDTENIDFPPGSTAPIRQASKAYFASQNFKSFASLPVVAHGRAIGVVNVESNLTEVFGSTRNQKELLAAYLMPFCAALGILLVD